MFVGFDWLLFRWNLFLHFPFGLAGPCNCNCNCNASTGGARGAGAGTGVSIPRVLLQLVDMPLQQELQLAADGAGLAAKVLGANEFTSEVSLRAHPERRSFFSKWTGSQPSQTLQAELAEVTFEGKVGGHA